MWIIGNERCCCTIWKGFWLKFKSLKSFVPRFSFLLKICVWCEVVMTRLHRKHSFHTSIDSLVPLSDHYDKLCSFVSLPALLLDHQYIFAILNSECRNTKSSLELLSNEKRDLFHQILCRNEWFTLQSLPFWFISVDQSMLKCSWTQTIPKQSNSVSMLYSNFAMQ